MRRRKRTATIETLFTAILDMVIASVIVVKISGIDLACAPQKSMSSIHDIPFTLLTSFDLPHPELRQLPDSVTLVHHNLNIDTELDAAV